MSTTTVSPEPNGALSRRAEINRANSEHSTGPKTEEGKKRSSLNAMRHGLTGQIMILPAEELAAYQLRCQEFRDQYQPQGPEEERLVQILADTAWRLLRVPAIEAGIQALGSGKRRRYRGVEDDDIRLSLATAAEVRDQSKAFANIAMYEQRLDRRYSNTLARLEALQARRRATEPAQTAQPKSQALQHHPAENGFVFSTTHIDAKSGAVPPDCQPAPSPANKFSRPSATQASSRPTNLR